MAPRLPAAAGSNQHSKLVRGVVGKNLAGEF